MRIVARPCDIENSELTTSVKKALGDMTAEEKIAEITWETVIHELEKRPIPWNLRIKWWYQRQVYATFPYFMKDFERR